MSNAQKRLWQLYVIGIAVSLSWGMAWYAYACTMHDKVIKEHKEYEGADQDSFTSFIHEEPEEQEEEIEREDVYIEGKRRIAIEKEYIF